MGRKDPKDNKNETYLQLCIRFDSYVTEVWNIYYKDIKNNRMEIEVLKKTYDKTMHIRATIIYEEANLKWWYKKWNASK